MAVLFVAASFAALGISGAAALAPLAGVLRPFGLPYELAFPLLVIVDPLAHMVRIMLNVTVNCLILALAAGNRNATVAQLAGPNKHNLFVRFMLPPLLDRRDEMIDKRGLAGL
jgi:Na+/H+-dicarboxylate symporter